MSKIVPFALLAMLAGANVLAADAPAAGTTTTTTTNADLEAQLAAARQKLEAAARDVAQLSSQLGKTAMARVRNLRSHAVLGLQLEVTPSAKEQGATVMDVSPGGPASEAGITSGDVIIALNGEPTTGPTAPRLVVEHMAAVRPDAKVTLKVIHDGKPKEVLVTARAGSFEFFNGFNGPAWGAGAPGGAWQPLELRSGPGGGVGAIFEGMELADLSPTLGEYFGTSQGVLVIRVPHDGEFLKLQDGDVIESIDGRVPENGSHATRILRSYQPGEKIHLKVMRQKKSLELEATLPERRRGPGPRPEGPGGHGPGLEDRPPPGAYRLPRPHEWPQPPAQRGHLVPLGLGGSNGQLAAALGPR